MCAAPGWLDTLRSWDAKLRASNHGGVVAGDATAIAQEISKLLRISGPLAQAKRDTEAYRRAVAAYDDALRATVIYMDKVKSHQEPFSRRRSSSYHASGVRLA